jgi:hypothetical protein
LFFEQKRSAKPHTRAHTRTIAHRTPHTTRTPARERMLRSGRGRRGIQVIAPKELRGERGRRARRTPQLLLQARNQPWHTFSKVPSMVPWHITFTRALTFQNVRQALSSTKALLSRRTTISATPPRPPPALSSASSRARHTYILKSTLYHAFT